MLKKVKNQISGIMISVMILGLALPGQQAFAATNTKDSTKTSASTETSESTKLQSDKLTAVEPYVSIIDNKYVLKIPSIIQKSINKDDLTLAENRVKTLNNLIDEYKVKDVSMKSGVTIIIDENKFANTSVSDFTNNIMLMAASTPEGVTKIEAHWNYAEIWLSKSACRRIGIGLAGAVTAIFGSALAAIPIAGPEVAAAIAGTVGAVFIDYMANKPYRAIYFDYNYISGPSETRHNQ